MLISWYTKDCSQAIGSQDNKTLLTEDMSGRHSFNENGKRLMSRYYQRWTLPEDRAWGRRGSWRVVEPAVGQSPLGKPVTNPLMFGLGVNTYIWLASKNTWNTRPSPWVMTSSMATPLCWRWNKRWVLSETKYFNKVEFKLKYFEKFWFLTVTSASIPRVPKTMKPA